MSHSPCQLRGLRGLGHAPFDLDLPLGQLVCLSGPSNAGKSGLLFGLLHRESQRRQRALDEDRPLPPAGPWRCDSLRGLPPTLALRLDAEPRGRVGDLLGAMPLLGAALEAEGGAICPSCEGTCRRWTAASLAAALIARRPEARVTLLAPIVRASSGSLVPLLAEVRAAGFARVRLDGIQHRLDELPTVDARLPHRLDVVVDRTRLDPAGRDRLIEAIETAWRAGADRLWAEIDGEEPLPAGRRPWCAACDRLLTPLGARSLLPGKADNCVTCAGIGLAPSGLPCPTCAGDGLPAPIRATPLGGPSVGAWLSTPLAQLSAFSLGDPLASALQSLLRTAREGDLEAVTLGAPVALLDEGARQRLALAALVARPLAGAALLIERPSANGGVAHLQALARLARVFIENGGSVVVEDDHPAWTGLADEVLTLPSPVRVAFPAEPLAPVAGEGRGLQIRALQRPDQPPLDLRMPAGAITPLFVDDPDAARLFLRGPLALAQRALGLKGETPWEAAAIEISAERLLALPLPRPKAGRGTLAHALDLWGPLRELLAATREAKVRGWGPERFSLHRPGGRCEACAGEGRALLHTPDGQGLDLPCVECGGQRFAAVTEAVRLHGKSPADLLRCGPDELAALFAAVPRVRRPAALFLRLSGSTPPIGAPMSSLSTTERDAAHLAALVAAVRPIELPRALFLLDRPGRRTAATPAFTALLGELAAAGAAVGLVP